MILVYQTSTFLTERTAMKIKHYIQLPTWRCGINAFLITIYLGIFMKYCNISGFISTFWLKIEESSVKCKKYDCKSFLIVLFFLNVAIAHYSDCQTNAFYMIFILKFHQILLVTSKLSKNGIILIALNLPFIRNPQKSPRL